MPPKGSKRSLPTEEQGQASKGPEEKVPKVAKAKGNSKAKAKDGALTLQKWVQDQQEAKNR